MWFLPVVSESHTAQGFFAAAYPDEEADVSAVDVGHVLGVVAVAAHADAPGETVEVGAFVGRQRDPSSRGVLADALGAAGPGDRHDPRLLRQQPGQGDLPGRRALGLGEALDVVDKGLVCGEIDRKSTRLNSSHVEISY